MRYFPMILAAGLLSAGLLAGSGPAHAIPTLALDRSAVADTQVKKVAYYHRYARRHYRRGYGYGYELWLPPALLWVWLPTGPITVMDMGVAGATERHADLNSRVNRSRWRKPRQGRIPPPDQPAGEPGSRPPRVAGFLVSGNPTQLASLLVLCAKLGRGIVKG